MQEDGISVVMQRSILAQSAVTERAIVASWEALGNAPVSLFKRRLERVLAVCGTRDGHMWLVNEFGLNLEGHRYPL